MSVWVVTAEESGQKLSVYLKAKLGAQCSARQIKQSLEHNACLVNGRAEKHATALVGKGDKIFFQGVLAKEQLSVAILYQDEYLLACNKPAGISSESPELLKQLSSTAAYLELLHRLDKETTGILLWAKTPAFAKLMLEMFKQRLIEKTYLAIVDKVPKHHSGHIESRLGKIHQYQGQSLWGPVDDGLTAITDWEVRQKLTQAAVVACYPKTGRTHQLRVHLSGLGHPILGDKQYGKKYTCSFRPGRCLLHAQKVQFTHPVTGKSIVIIALPAEDFQAAIDHLGKR